jgi:broad specificity phosphatase PhoE
MKAPGLLILVKHSEPVIDPSQPANVWHLSQVGKLRCKGLAKHLSGYQVQAIVSSLEPKAVETAQITADALGLSPKRWENLHEHERSRGTSFSKRQFERSVAALFAHPDQLVFGNETAHQALQRFEQAVYKLVDETPVQRLVVVSHGTVISLFTAHHTGIDAYVLWKRLGLPGFVVLTFPNYQLKEIVDCIP